jgi:5'-phosphate synthase pdxT subunit
LKNKEKLIVGVLAVQGDFAEHIAILKKIGVETREVRLPKDLDGVDAVIIPGGESTTLRKLFDLYGLTDAITGVAKKGTPIWGTCAGMIMLAKELTDDRPEPLHLMDITVTRNAYGRQVDSFEADIDFPKVGKKPFRAVFIRAPAIDKVESGVEILGKLSDGSPVALQQGNLLVTSFHPELTEDTRFHKFFLSLVKPIDGRNRDKD